MLCELVTLKTWAGQADQAEINKTLRNFEAQVKKNGLKVCIKNAQILIEESSGYKTYRLAIFYTQRYISQIEASKAVY